MPDGSEDSVTTQIQETEAEAQKIIEEARRLLSALDVHQATPLIDYETTIADLETDIEQATGGLRLGDEELETAQEATRVLRRVNTAVTAQLTAYRRATEQRLEYLEDWVADLRDFAVELADGTTPEEAHEETLAPLTEWLQKADQYVAAEKHVELVAEDGAHTLSELQTRIEDTAGTFREGAPDSAKVTYLQALCETEVEYLERVIDRLERVTSSQDQFSTEGLQSDISAATSAESLQELLEEIRAQRQAAVTQADKATETAMALDALEEMGFPHAEMEQLHQNATENLRTGNIDTCRRQTSKLIKWETELAPIDRFEIVLSEHNGELLQIVEQTAFSIDDALDHVSELYASDAIEGIAVRLK